jgi:hypothetical protein
MRWPAVLRLFAPRRPRRPDGRGADGTRSQRPAPACAGASAMIGGLRPDAAARSSRALGQGGPALCRWRCAGARCGNPPAWVRDSWRGWRGSGRSAHRTVRRCRRVTAGPKILTQQIRLSGHIATLIRMSVGEPGLVTPRGAGALAGWVTRSKHGDHEPATRSRHRWIGLHRRPLHPCARRAGLPRAHHSPIADP